jgi:hypothetical protein
MAKNDSGNGTTDETVEPTPVAPSGKARSLAEITGAMGMKLETIKGQPIVVTGLVFDVRQVHKLDDGGRPLEDLEDKEVVFIMVGEDKYYSFSAPLIAKLHTVNVTEDLPAAATFDVKSIGGGRTVWVIQ